eukprot:CAMPEP_0117069830 /NCGR_PEP_ID=MMETSP0472-20121206/49009_1 /TAXON_ID=693140 ORGANISM="Tiarina fusus, Strain LIS" /NCGR_SAMPLE_ID=MMETSP0472 /ASSEMBLY_ACC=CAM_ASM_000603 /LENGTH=184 /DNA_ID=CAMNT_0004792589 /DNA_START=911 /DNA_END=1466 /DNA_ORIENTATION=-
MIFLPVTSWVTTSFSPISRVSLNTLVGISFENLDATRSIKIDEDDDFAASVVDGPAPAASVVDRPGASDETDTWISGATMPPSARLSGATLEGWQQYQQMLSRAFEIELYNDSVSAQKPESRSSPSQQLSSLHIRAAFNNSSSHETVLAIAAFCTGAGPTDKATPRSSRQQWWQADSAASPSVK